MRVLTARINILEPLMFRDSGEFDPSSRGVYSYAKSLFVPRPSTIIGALITHLLGYLNIKLVRKCFDISRFDDVIECYDMILNEYGIEAIRGPYLYDSGNNVAYIPLLLNFKSPRLLPFNQVQNLLIKKHGDVLQKIFKHEVSEELLSELKDIEYTIKREAIDIHKLKRITIVGIKLKDREDGVKTVKVGHIYSVDYSAYPKDFEIRFKLIVKDESPIIKKLNEKVPLKFGGEHRVALITIGDEGDIFDDEFLRTDFKYAILISPMPINSKEVVFDYIGQLGTIGLGFSISRGRRKPIHSAILEGSIVRNTSKGNLDRSKLLKFGFYYVANLTDSLEHNILGRIGYGTFIPLESV